MHKMTAPAAMVAAMIAATALPAHAADEPGKLQIKVLATAVLPDGKIDKVNKDLVGLPAGTQTEANNNVVPTVAIEYFFSDNVSLETICCMTQHDVDGTTGLPGAELVADAKIIPATFTLKYHFGEAGGVQPYIGAGPTYFIFVDEKPGAAAKGLGANGFGMDDNLGVALQAGVDVPVNEGGMVVSLDAKKYFVGTTAHWYVGANEVISTDHKLDPWVLSAGVGFRF